MNQLVQKLLTPWTSNMNDNNIDESDTMIVPSSCDNQVQVRNSGKYATSQQLEARSKQTFILKKKNVAMCPQSNLWISYHASPKCLLIGFVGGSRSADILSVTGLTLLPRDISFLWQSLDATNAWGVAWRHTHKEIHCIHQNTFERLCQVIPVFPWHASLVRPWKVNPLHQLSIGLR